MLGHEAKWVYTTPLTQRKMYVQCTKTVVRRYKCVGQCWCGISLDGILTFEEWSIVQKNRTDNARIIHLAVISMACRNS